MEPKKLRILRRILQRRLRRLINGTTFPLSFRSRKKYYALAGYYPPTYSLRKIVGFYMVLHALRKHSIEGDIVECGVGRGHSFYIIGYFINQLQLGRRLYGFDSFEGFPEPVKHDESPRNPRKGGLWNETSVDHIKQHFIDRGLEDFLKYVLLVQGFFDKTLHLVSGLDKISFLNLDVDLYDSYRICMKTLGPRVSGLILYDEYNTPRWPGATRAINEILPELNHILFFSVLMQRYFSLPEAHMSSEFGCEILAVLQGKIVDSVRVKF